LLKNGSWLRSTGKENMRNSGRGTAFPSIYKCMYSIKGMFKERPFQTSSFLLKFLTLVWSSRREVIFSLSW